MLCLFVCLFFFSSRRRHTRCELVTGVQTCALPILPKKGTHSVGVAPQYASSLGKTANCQSLVSVTLASREVPVMVGLRLFLPDSWTSDVDKMTRAQVPKECQIARTKPEIAMEEIDRVIATGARFGCALRSEEHTSELQSLMRISYAVFCLKKKKKEEQTKQTHIRTSET